MSARLAEGAWGIAATLAMPALRAEIVKYAGNDLMLYRADTPEGLVHRQEEVWDAALVKLARQFGAADTQNTGSITQAQARAAGLGYVANHFRQIDASGRGRVSFSDVQRYVQARSANQQ